MSEPIAHPPITSRAEWLAARKELLTEEKALTKAYDRLNAKRRRLPMVKVDKDYRFTGPDGEKSLLDLFDGQTQLIVMHFMFDTDWQRGCPGCTAFMKALGDLTTLHNRDTRFVLISRAPIEKLEAYRKEMGWKYPWYSSGGTDFNVDFGVTLGPVLGEVTSNYKSKEELEKMIGKPLESMEKTMEGSGQSVFFRVGDDIYHTYSTYARGSEGLNDAYRLLDITPYGRQEDFEDSPEGWPQKPTYG